MTRPSRTPRVASLCLVAAATFWLTACGDSGDEAATTPTPTVTTTAPSPSPTTSAEQVDAARAAEIALGQEQGASVVSVDRSTQGGQPVWEVELLTSGGTGTEVTIDQATGAVLKTEATDLDSEERTAPDVTATQAIEISLQQVPGEVIELGLGTEAGQVVWEVEVQPASGARQELTISADSGKILKQEAAD